MLSIGKITASNNPNYLYEVKLPIATFFVNPDQYAMAQSLENCDAVVKFFPEDQFCRIVPMEEIETLFKISTEYFKEHTSKVDDNSHLPV